VLIAVLVTVHRIVFPQRMAHPIGWHENPAKVGMIAEADAEQIDDFPLVPIRHTPVTESISDSDSETQHFRRSLELSSSE